MAQFASRDGRLSPAHDMPQYTLGFVQAILVPVDMAH